MIKMAAAIVVSSTLIFSQARAAVFPELLGFEVAIDRKTRDLIASLPNEARVQAFRLLQDSLPLIDKSVLLYLDKIDQIMYSNFKEIAYHLNCSAESFIRSPWRIKNVKDLREEKEDALGKIKQGSSAVDIRDIYTDFIQKAETFRCEVKDMDGPVQETDLQIRSIHERWVPWYRLSEKCVDITLCYTTTRSEIDEDIRIAHPRDISEVDAKVRLARVVAPGQLNNPKSHLDPILHENALRQLLYISDGLALAKIKRKKEALNRLNEAKNMRVEPKRLFGFIHGSILLPKNYNHNAGLYDQMTAQVNNLTAINNLMPDIRSLDPDLAAEINIFAEENNDMISKGRDLMRQATEYNQNIINQRNIQKNNDQIRDNRPFGQGGILR